MFRLLAAIPAAFLACIFAAIPAAVLPFSCALAQEKVIVERSSQFNKSVVVTEDESGLRTLRFGRDGVRQSVVNPKDPGHLELAYLRAAPLALVLVPSPRSTLVIGLGGGSLPMFLRHKFPDMAIDAVDIDPVVVELAKSHLNFREDGSMRAHVADGRAFIEKSVRRYDLVFLDAYSGDEVPYSLATREFLDAVKRVLSPGGAVISNIWGRRDNALYDSMLRTYQAVFDEVSLVQVQRANNVLVLATPWKPGLTRQEAHRRAAEVVRRHSLRDDLAAIVERGFRQEQPSPRSRVLIDAEATRPRN
jgi:spermidine synthase